MVQKTKRTRLTNLFMIIVVLITSIQAFAALDSFENSAIVDGKESSNRLAENLVSDLTLEELPDQLSETIDLDTAKVTKIDTIDADSLDSLTTIHEDGTKTLHMYEVPVKYFDEKDGQIKFIDNTITEVSFTKKLLSPYAYTNADNDITVSFPKKVKSGVLLEDDDYSFNMTPVTTVNSPATYREYTFLAFDEKVVEYANAFGEGYHLQYAATNTGLKENILVDAYNGTHTFQFQIKASGLIPEQTEGACINFVDEKTGEIIYTVGQTYIRDSYTEGGSPEIDSARHISYDNSYTIEDLGNNEYLLTSITDKAFLESETTVYPVLIDPTVTKNLTGLKECAVRSNNSRMTGSWNRAGYCSDIGANSRVYVKYTSTQNYRYINPANITSAVYRTYEGSGTTYASTIQVYNSNYKGAIESATYSNVTLGSSVSQLAISSSGWKEFNIKSLFQSWLKYELGEGGKAQAYGFVLRGSTASTKEKHFSSRSNSSYLSTLKLTYNEETPSSASTGSKKGIANGTYYIKNVRAKKLLDAEQSMNYNVISYPFHGDKNQQWKVEYVGNGFYKLHNQWPKYSGYALDTCTADDITEADLYSNWDNDWVLFRIVKNGDGTYRIMSTYGGLYRALDAELNHINAGRKDVNTIFYPYKETTNQKWEFFPYVSNAFTNNGGLGSNTVTIELTGSTTTNTTWKPLIEAARNSWNNSGAGIKITTTTNTSPHKLIVGSYPVEEWEGLCTKAPLGENVAVTASLIRIDNSKLLKDNNPNLRKAIITHEMGHLFWLGDNPSAIGSSIMVNRHILNDSIYTPQKFDIGNVKVRYDK